LTARRQGLIRIFLLLFVLAVWSYLGFIAVLAGSQKSVIVQEGNPERDSDMASYLCGAVLHFVVPPVVKIAFMAVSFSGTGRAWRTAALGGWCWRATGLFSASSASLDS
jgi:hypothetical protein